jgi:hypothetical protein
VDQVVVQRLVLAKQEALRQRCIEEKLDLLNIFLDLN